jgi:hypothetical protein
MDELILGSQPKEPFTGNAKKYRLPVKDGPSHFGMSHREYTSLVTEGAERMGVKVRPTTHVHTSSALYAYVNAGRWIVRCPDCGSCEYIWPDSPLFLCSNCFNVTVNGQWRPVVIPKEKARIDDLLAWRPIFNRNWEPEETIKQLKAENLGHGLPREED